MTRDRKVLTLILAMMVVSVIGWYFLSQPKLVLTLKYDKPLILFGNLLVNSTKVEEILPEPLKPYTLPTMPNLTLLRIGFGSCHVTTPEGSATTFLVFLSGNIDGASVSQATNGKLDFSIHEFIYRIYVNNQNAVGLLFKLGLPVELTEISLDNSTIGSKNRVMLIVSDKQGDMPLNMTLLSEISPVATLPPEPQQDVNVKIGWVFGEEGKLKALRFKRDYNNGGSVYPLTEGIIEVSSSSPFYQAFGSTRYDLAATLQHYLGSQGKVMAMLNGGESQFVEP